MAQLPLPQDLRVELECSNCGWNETRQANWDRRKSVYVESEKAKKWHEDLNCHRVIQTVTEISEPVSFDEDDPQTLGEIKEAAAGSTSARIQILELPLEQGGDLGDETRSRFTVIVDRAPAHLADSKDFQDAMKDFARDSGAETAFVTSETLEIAEL